MFAAVKEQNSSITHRVLSDIYRLTKQLQKSQRGNFLKRLNSSGGYKQRLQDLRTRLTESVQVFTVSEMGVITFSGKRTYGPSCRQL